MKPVVLRKKFTPSRQLKRLCCCYWTAAISFMITILGIQYFLYRYVVEDKITSTAEKVGSFCTFLTVGTSIFCGLIYKCDINNPLISLVGILSLCYGPYYCIQGIIIAMSAKNAIKSTNASFYLEKLKQFWKHKKDFPRWITNTQRYHVSHENKVIDMFVESSTTQRCCGILSYKDYRVHVYGDDGNGDIDFPQSCCELRRWERLYKDPKPLEQFCNINVFNRDQVDNRDEYQKIIESDLYRNQSVPFERESIDYSSFYTTGCYTNLVAAGEEAVDALIVLQVICAFWCIVLIVIHVVRLDKYCRQPVMTSEEIATYELHFIGESGEVSSDELELQEEEVEAPTAADEMVNSVRKSISKPVVQDTADDTSGSLVRLYKRHRKYATDSDSFDEMDHDDMKRKHRVLKARDRFEFLVSIHRDCPEEQYKYDQSETDSDENDASGTPKKRKQISPNVSKIYLDELRKLENRKRRTDELKEAIREQRGATSNKGDFERRRSFNSPSDIFLPPSTQDDKKKKIKFRGPAYSEGQKETLLNLQRERRRQKEANKLL